MAPSEHHHKYEPIMIKSQSQQGNICFTQNNPHTDFISHAHNAFMKKANLPPQ